MSVFVARLRAMIPDRLAALVRRHLPVPTLAENPESPLAWVAEARSRPDVTRETIQRLDAHGLRPHSSNLVFFEPFIRQQARPKLTSLSRDPASIAEAIDEIVRWLTIAQCTFSHRAGGYFDAAERVMDVQWDNTIWPIIKDSDFSSVLELACGHGRNSAKLLQHTQDIVLVDANASGIEACRLRFAGSSASIGYHVTDGNHFRMVPDSSITFGYSWDSMVHFDKLVVRDYLFEFARTLKPGGTAFLHTSNYGAIKPNSSWTTNHGSRSDLSRELFNNYAAEAGLSIEFQRLSGRADGWGVDDLDCVSVVSKSC